MCQAWRSKRVAVAPLGLGPAGQPHPLAELVADGLARHAEVADDLALQQLGVAAAVGQQELAASAGVQRSPGWNG